mmetsp:Transcript_101172/g.285232  ORF Transcript_101172/g.285232 Transcript_101172/m.285232 type:complete len:215 (-) Transcript_101172:405-1049(-)
MDAVEALRVLETREVHLELGVFGDFGFLRRELPTKFDNPVLEFVLRLCEVVHLGGELLYLVASVRDIPAQAPYVLAEELVSVPDLVEVRERYSCLFFELLVRLEELLVLRVGVLACSLLGGESGFEVCKLAHIGGEFLFEWRIPFLQRCDLSGEFRRPVFFLLGSCLVAAHHRVKRHVRLFDVLGLELCLAEQLDAGHRPIGVNGLHDLSNDRP